MKKELEKELNKLTGFDGQYVQTDETLSFECESIKMVITKESTPGRTFEITYQELLKKILETEEGKKIVANAIVDLKK